MMIRVKTAVSFSGRSNRDHFFVVEMMFVPTMYGQVPSRNGSFESPF